MLDFDRRLLVVAGLIVILAAFMGYKFGRHVEAEKAAVRESLATSQEEKQPVKNEDKKVFVYVVGAVQQPGVIQMTSGDRVFQAVDQARPVADADLQQLNLASPVNDGDKIYVPRMGEKTSSQSYNPGTYGSGTATTGAGTGATSSTLVNINTASMQELDDKLPGIGPAYAQRIVDYRQQHGGFKSIEELKEVSGIGEKRFQQMKDMVCL